MKLIYKVLRVNYRNEKRPRINPRRRLKATSNRVASRAWSLSLSRSLSLSSLSLSLSPLSLSLFSLPPPPPSLSLSLALSYLVYKVFNKHTISLWEKIRLKLQMLTELWNDRSEFFKKGSTRIWNFPTDYDILKAVSWISSASIGIWWNPDFKSITWWNFVFQIDQRFLRC